MPRIAKEVVDTWLQDKYWKIMTEIIPRARQESYGGKFSQSIKMKSRMTDAGADGYVYSEHPRAVEIIKDFEVGRPPYTASRAFFIEKSGFNKGDKTPEGYIITTNREGVPGIWVSKSGFEKKREAEHTWSVIAYSRPFLNEIYEDVYKKRMGGA